MYLIEPKSILFEIKTLIRGLISFFHLILEAQAHLFGAFKTFA